MEVSFGIHSTLIMIVPQLVLRVRMLHANVPVATVQKGIVKFVLNVEVDVIVYPFSGYVVLVDQYYLANLTVSSVSAVRQKTIV